MIDEVIGFPLAQTVLPVFKLLLRLLTQTRKTQESNDDLFFGVSETILHLTIPAYYTETTGLQTLFLTYQYFMFKTHSVFTSYIKFTFLSVGSNNFSEFLHIVNLIVNSPYFS